MILTDGSEISLAQTLDLCEECSSLSNAKGSHYLPKKPLGIE